MKLIKQSFEFINQTDFSLVGIKKHIERCARVSYKSEDKITDTSYEKFVNMLESRGHDRPLEFGTVYLTLRGDDTDALRNIFIYAENPWTKIRKQVIKAEYDPNTYVVLNHVTTNYRVIVENHLEEDLQYLCEPTEYHHKRYTVHMILDRGVMDEFRTHIGLSHLAESTRYCNYSKDKFGNDLTFIKPCWLPNLSEGKYTDFDGLWYCNDLYIDEELNVQEEVFLEYLEYAENGYFALLNQGWTPQQARSVLPLGIKSELISCGFEDAWENFMRRRSPKYGDPGAHPMAAEIADKLCEEFLKRGFIDEKKI